MHDILRIDLGRFRDVDLRTDLRSLLDLDPVRTELSFRIVRILRILISLILRSFLSLILFIIRIRIVS